MTCDDPTLHLHPNSENLGILNALSALAVICEARIGLAAYEDDLLALRSWQAAEGIVAHSIDKLCARAEIPR